MYSFNFLSLQSLFVWPPHHVCIRDVCLYILVRCSSVILWIMKHMMVYTKFSSVSRNNNWSVTFRSVRIMFKIDHLPIAVFEEWWLQVWGWWADLVFILFLLSLNMFRVPQVKLYFSNSNSLTIKILQIWPQIFSSGSTTCLTGILQRECQKSS